MIRLSYGILICWLVIGSARAEEVQAFLKNHCLKCHDSRKTSGDVRLDNLAADFTQESARWLAVRDQIRDGLMPPAKEPKPKPEEAKSVVLAISKATAHRAARLPNQGNLIPHELLFGQRATNAIPPPPRVWRLSPDNYMGFVRDITRGKSPTGVVQPFTLIAERGIRDFAGLYTIDEPSTEILIRNAEAMVEVQTAHEFKDGKISGKNDSVREFVALMDPAKTPTMGELEAAIQTQFKIALGRPASTEDVTRFLGLYDRCRKVSDSPGSVKTMLQAVLLRTDAMFRSELGRPSDTGRRRLSPEELAAALSLSLMDRRESKLMQAAQKGELVSKEQIVEHLKRILDDPKSDQQSRVLGFFREYFDYPNATNVFKDKPKTFVHEPRQLVSDTDRLILDILKTDRDVFRELLTTNNSFVNYTTFRNKKLNREEAKPAVVLNPNNNKGQTGVESVYGLSTWPEQQPATLPADSRIGILMQPSWLIAYSTNFDNDPVRRGRWIRERLLGGTVPDLPIGVVAQVPDDPHRTFRDRLTVTREAKCWKCHQKMDELGLPFENFDHFGRFRSTEEVRDLEATAKNVDKKGKSLGPVLKEVPLVSTGIIADSGDPALDGPVNNPREMLRKIANSDRARQVFIRHVFRYFLGRNETLSDAKTLQDADNAYLQSGGSFKALLVSLLTSDTFVYRSELPKEEMK